MKFLVATDGSPESMAALERCLDIAEPLDAFVEVVHVVQPELHDLGGEGPIESAVEAAEKMVFESVSDAEDRGLDFLEDAESVLADHDVEYETGLLYGDPAPEISDYAEEAGFDGVFVGHRGRSRRMEYHLGSVAADLVQRATVPVTVVR